MASGDLGVTNFMKLWYQSDQTSERKMVKFLLAGLDQQVRADSDFLSKIKKGPSISTPVMRWMEEKGYPDAVTGQLTTAELAISGTLFGETRTEELIKKVIRVGTILERESDGVQAKVTALTNVASPNFSVTVAAYGNTTLSDDTGGVTWRIISEPWSDFREIEQPRSLDRVFREVGTQIFAEAFQIPKTRKNTKYEIVGDEVMHQIDALLGKMRRSLAFAVLRSRPYYNSGYKFGTAVEDPTMCGLLTWPVITQAEAANTSVYVNKSLAELTKADLDDLARNMWLTEHSNFNRGNWVILTDPITHNYIHDFDISYRRKTEDSKSAGFSVDVFDSKIGKTFPIMNDPYMRPGTLVIVNLSEMSYGYYADDQLDRKEVETKGRFQEWLISFQTYGVVARNPRANIGMIYGLPQS